MATNKLALIRYKTIDTCLRNRLKKWTLEALIEKVSHALYEYEGIRDGVSKRTIQSDIELMRSNKLGYNAPIIVVGRTAASDVATASCVEISKNRVKTGT